MSDLTESVSRPLAMVLLQMQTESGQVCYTPTMLSAN
jgi:hypothetical protein